MHKPRLVVFFGGTSGSHDLSEETGHWVCQYLPREKYQVTPVHITEHGEWQVPLGSLPTTGNVRQTINMLLQAVPSMSPDQALQRLLHKPVDALFTVLRGAGGDDGSLHHLGQTLSIPVVGSPVHTCHTTSDKHLCALATEDIVSSPHARQWRTHVPVEEIVEATRQEFVPPLFIKPTHEEGSTGVRKIQAIENLAGAIGHARVSGNVLIQEHAPGQEISLTLIQDGQGKLRALPPTMIVPQAASFYDAAAKRRSGHVKLHTPSNQQSNHVLAEAEMIARDVYEQLGCQGIAQIDLVAGENGIQLLEVNTIPTLTEHTPLLHQLRAAGLHPATMLDNLVNQTLN